MKILIVDDNATNRMVLQALLDEYINPNADKEVIFEIDEAEDGEEAVKKASTNKYDLILMDINMPKMDGIEASGLIRSKDKKVMIIAVSAADDAEKRSKILNSGAEDYISKPIDADIFHSRLSNYISLIESRNKENYSSKVANLYTHKVYSRHTMFLLDTEDSVGEFWEFFLLNARKKSNHLSDIVRVIVAIVDELMKISENNRVYIEESDSKQYFTLINIEVLPRKVVELILRKNNLRDCYKLESNKISFELIKAKQYEDESHNAPHVPITLNKTAPTVKKETPIAKQVSPIVKEEASSAAFGDYTSQELKVFNYMDAEDLLDLEEYAGKLNSVMMLVGSGDITEEDVVEIYANLDKVSNIVSSYTDIYPISVALAELSADMSSHIDEFIEQSESLGSMCSAFSRDLSNWLNQSFYSGAPSIDFMNDTIVVNCQTICMMLKMDEAPPAGADDFDDIFDF